MVRVVRQTDLDQPAIVLGHLHCDRLFPSRSMLQFRVNNLLVHMVGHAYTLWLDLALGGRSHAANGLG